MGAQNEAASNRPRLETAVTLIGSGNLAAAEPILRGLLAEEPHHSPAVQLLATVLVRSGRSAAAESLLWHHLTVNPGDAVAHNNLGEICRAVGKLEDAARCFRQAVRLVPVFAEARYALAGALAALGHVPAAVDEYRECLALRPAWPAAQLSLADAYVELGQYAAAVELYEQVPPNDPPAKDVDLVLGHVYQAQGNLVQARAAYQRHARRSSGGWLAALSAKCLCEPVAANTEAIDEAHLRVEAAVEQALEDAAGPIDPATLHASGAEPPMLLAYYGRNLLPLMSRFATLFGRVIPASRAEFGSQKPRVGIVVTAGHEGVFARCLGRLVEQLSAARLDVQVLCSPRGASTLRQMLPGTTLSFLLLPRRIDEAAAQIRAAKFDLLYYWELGTDAVSYFLPFFAPAPLQVAGWGWPVTSGNRRVSHYCSARMLEPPDAAEHYSERLVQLEYLPTWFAKPRLPRLRTRADFDFSGDEHLYLCTQNLRKYHPDFDPVVSEILERDSQGRVVIIGDEQPAITEKLLHRFRATMPDVVERIRVLPRMDRETYLNVLSLADVVLDTLHYGGGANTVLDACGVGTPIVTLPGAFQRGRWTQAVYRQLGIGETIAGGLPEYVEWALSIGGTPDLRESLKRRIVENCESLYESRAAVIEHEEFFLRTIEEGRSQQP